jgi:hypothetical protein
VRFAEGPTLIRWRTLVAVLGVLTVAWAPALRASVPSTRAALPPGSGRSAVFGILSTDSEGQPLFVRTDSVPNVEGQAYGWFIEVGDSKLPVRWTETLTLPAPAASWGDEGASPTPGLSVAADSRSAVVEGEDVPEFGVIEHFWSVVAGDPSGHYTIVVKLPGGREERFDFTLFATGAKDGAR